MKLYLKQRLFSWGDKFSVYGENGEEHYFVQGEVFSWGKKLHIYERTECEVAFIQQKLFSFRPRYEILQNGIPFAEVIKEFTFFKHLYHVAGPDWRVEGDFWDHEYRILRGNDVIASVSKQWFTFGDAYEIDIDPNINDLSALAVVLVIDACIEAEQNQN